MQIVVFLVLCFLVSLLAINRRPGPVVVFLIAMFFTPLIGLIVALFAKKKPTPPKVPIITEGEMEVSHIPEQQTADTVKQYVVVEDVSGVMPVVEEDSQSSEAVYCDNCGHPLDGDSAFCPHCGKSVE